MLGWFSSLLASIVAAVGASGARQADLYREANQQYGAALERLVRGYERQEQGREDLLQEIHVALWRSCASFDERCSLRTWVYRVAHNVAASRVLKDKRSRARGWASLAELEVLPSRTDTEAEVTERHALARLLELVERLHPVERQLILLYLDGLDAASIGEVTGHSAANVATKVHRIKQVLARQFEESA